MQAKLIQIGSSRGVRFPKLLIEKYDFTSGVEFKECEDGILVTKSKQSRQGWAESFEALSKRQEQELEMWQDMDNQFDGEEWEW